MIWSDELLLGHPAIDAELLQAVTEHANAPSGTAHNNANG